jgi:predicted metal-dependent peptidase
LTEFLPEEDIPDETIKTIATNGLVIKYNPKFLYSKNLSQLMFMYMHEVAHIFLAHPLRIRPEHDFDTAQRAADYVTNDLLDDAGLTLPSDALIDHKYRGMSYEEVYGILEHNQKNQNFKDKHDQNRRGTCEQQPKGKKNQKGDPHEKCDDPHNNQQDQSEQERQEQLAKHEQRQQSAMQMAEMIGNVSADLQRRFNKLKEKPVDWREALPAEIDYTLGMDDYSYAVPNNNIDDDTFIYPGMIGSKAKPIGVIVDTSGSVSVQALEEMTRDIVSIVEKSEPERVDVLGVDTAIKTNQSFEGDDTDILSKIQLKGGGGTSFRPGIEYLNDNTDDMGLVIYLTDGWCHSYPAEPYFPVVWLLYGGYSRFSPPFGKVIKMN